MRSLDSKERQDGYDAPASQQHDVMGRWRFAAEIARVAAEAPTDWSVRIGVFGKWGTGKTTVLHYVAQQVAVSNHIPVWLNPWHAENPSELWSQFVIALHDAAHGAGLEVEGAVADKARKHLGFLARMGVAATSLLNEQLGKLADEAVDLLGARGLLTLGREQAMKLASQIAPRRFVVLVDDLDRARPELVPHILFSLKELLDVGGFSFVLGFDPEIVEEFLTKHYSTHVLGKGFLDKIIDFPRILPEPTTAQIVALAIQQCAERCSFVDEQALKRTLPFIGHNPRSVKRFVENLFFLEREVGRHKVGEINWDVLLLCQVLHSKSRRLADVLFSDGKDSPFTDYRAAKLWARSGQQDDDSLERLRKAIASAGISEAQTTEVVGLLDAMAERSGVFAAPEMYLYHADLLDRPHAVTWNEYEEFRTAWDEAPTVATIKAWANNHATTRREQPERVLHELWSATLRRYTDHLGKTANTNLHRELEESIDSGKTTLRLLRQLGLDAGGFVEPSPFLFLGEFRAVFHAFAEYAHFLEPDSYLALRRAERELLLDISRATEERSEELIELLEPWLEDPISEHRNELRQAIIETVIPKIFEHLFAQFRAPNGITAVLDARSASAANYVIFWNGGAWWTPDRIDALKQIVAEASKVPVIHENIIAFVERIGRAVRGGSIQNPTANDIWKEIVRLTWTGLVAHPLQYRAIGTYRRTREKLQEAFGIDLDVPDWWDVMGPTRPPSQA